MRVNTVYITSTELDTYNLKRERKEKKLVVLDADLELPAMYNYFLACE